MAIFVKWQANNATVLSQLITVMVEKMHCFMYDSRVIENEQQVRLHTHVRKIGNLLHAVVSFFVTCFLFILINFLLSNLIQHTHMSMISTMRFVHSSAELLLSDSALSAISFAYQHSFGIMLALAFSCVYGCALVLKSLCTSENNAEKEKETYSKDSGEFHTEVGCSTISYRHKVCFLS